MKKKECMRYRKDERDYSNFPQSCSSCNSRFNANLNETRALFRFFCKNCIKRKQMEIEHKIDKNVVKIIQDQLYRTQETDERFKNKKKEIEELATEHAHNLHSSNSFYDKFPIEYKEAMSNSRCPNFLRGIAGLRIDKKAVEF